MHLDTSFSHELGEPWEPYERLLHAGLMGDHQLFARQDSVEETWRIVQPLLDAPPTPHTHQRGSWGPARWSPWFVAISAGSSNDWPTAEES